MFFLAATSMLRDMKRLFTGMGGITLAVIIILLIEGFAAGIYRQSTAYIEKNGADLYVGQKGVETIQNISSFVPRTLELEIAATPGVKDATSIYAIPTILDIGESKTTIILYGFRNGEEMGGPWSLVSGRKPTQDDEIILDRVLAKQNGLATGAKVQVLGRNFEIVGLSAETNAFMNSSAFITEAAAADLLETPELVSFVLVKEENYNNDGNIKKELNANFPLFTTLTRLEMAENTNLQLKEVLGAPLAVILAVAFLVGLMIAGLTSNMVVLEKIKDFGMLKALGASNATLFKVVILESLIWTIMGFGTGVLLAKAAAWSIMQAFPQFDIFIASASLFKAGIIAIALNILCTIPPIRRVGSLDPARVFSS